MLRIMLCCSAGMSTSLLVTRMEAAAKEKGVDAKIWAVSEAVVATEEGNFDCLLLGPQIRFKFKEFSKKYGDKVPVAVIDMRDYGQMNGAKVLDFALGLLNK